MVKTFLCLCKNPLFYENTRCLVCEREVGWCPICQEIVPLLPMEPEGYRCGQSTCETPLLKCTNYAVEQVCNRCLVSDSAASCAASLCDCCRYNAVIPDLSVPGNREKWYQLEVAKRRLFYTINLLGLPHGTASEGFVFPLSFDFKADVLPSAGLWRKMSGTERVYTGHTNGKITINICEADDVEREKLRVDLGEAHRTLVGHFRHEIGHYYWELLVQEDHEEEFQEIFGDPDHPSYNEAIDRHYRDGAPENWMEQYISAYASMHPWEDFAETFANYLNIVEVLDTAKNMHLHQDLPEPEDGLDVMVSHYQRLGIALNEMNRAMGLLDLVPTVLAPAVIEKLRYVHTLIGLPDRS